MPVTRPMYRAWLATRLWHGALSGYGMLDLVLHCTRAVYSGDPYCRGLPALLQEAEARANRGFVVRTAERNQDSKLLLVFNPMMSNVSSTGHD